MASLVLHGLFEDFAFAGFRAVFLCPMSWTVAHEAATCEAQGKAQGCYCFFIIWILVCSVARAGFLPRPASSRIRITGLASCAVSRQYEETS